MSEWYCPACGPARNDADDYSHLLAPSMAVRICGCCKDSLIYATRKPPFITAMQEEIAALRAERATLSNGLMIQTDQVEHSEKVIEELEKVAEHAAALFYNHELTETWDALEEALRSAGYLKEDGDE